MRNLDIEMPLEYEGDPTLPKDWWKKVDWGPWVSECKIEGCERPYAGQGYCYYHYSRVIRRRLPAEGGRSSKALNQDPISEDEWVRTHEYKSQGWSDKDIAFELNRTNAEVKEMLEQPSWSCYKNRDNPSLWMNDHFLK